MSKKTVTSNPVYKMLGGLGAILKIPGFCALFSIGISLIFKEYNGIKAFGITAAVCLIPAYVLSLSFRQRQFNFIEIMVLAVLGWTLTILAGTLPFLLFHNTEELHPVNFPLFSRFINALFEATSGFTSTGLTMVISESELTHSLQWWRTLMQWVGGIGIIIFLATFFSPDIKPADNHYMDDTTTSEKPSIGPSFSNTWWIYLIFTAISILALYLQDVPLWESINHGMTAIATGGFSITDNSLSHYSPRLLITVALIMIIGSFSFKTYRKVFTRPSLLVLIKDRQVQVFLAILVVGIGILTAVNQARAIPAIDSFFQFSSALATGGFTSAKPGNWSSIAMILLSIAMMIGGTTNSTTGGIKIFRLMVFVKGVFINFTSQATNAGKGVKLKLTTDFFKNKASRTVFQNATGFIAIWFISYWIIVLIISTQISDTYALDKIMFEAASAIGNVGQSSGITSPFIPDSTKITLMIAMFLGRLELIPLMLLSLSFLKKTPLVK